MKKTLRNIFVFAGIASINLIIAKCIIEYLDLKGINDIGFAIAAVVTLAINKSLQEE